LHQVRIRAKQLRYAAESAARVVGRPARRVATAAAALQEVLGDHHDAVAAEGWLRQAATAGSDAEVLVAGQLIAVERAAAASRRAAWPQAWSALRAGRTRRWLR
jgi:CHAD domain-containing protein